MDLYSASGIIRKIPGTLFEYLPEELRRRLNLFRCNYQVKTDIGTNKRREATVTIILPNNITLRFAINKEYIYSLLKKKIKPITNLLTASLSNISYELATYYPVYADIFLTTQGKGTITITRRPNNTSNFDTTLYVCNELISALESIENSALEYGIYNKL